MLFRSGVRIAIETVDAGDPHPNTYRLTLRSEGETRTLRAISTGGGMMEVIDLDGFAAVNESGGRDAGDEVLCHWAAALTAQLRSCDLVCRYGADEFLLVLPETAEQQADAALERVLGATQQLAVEVARETVALSASAGVASYPDDGRTVEELVAKAATTMYTARAGGPGRIAFYSHPPRR